MATVLEWGHGGSPPQCHWHLPPSTAPTRTPPPTPVQQEILEGRSPPHTTLYVMAVNRLKSSPKAPQSP